MDLENMTCPSDWFYSAAVQLTDGEYRQRAAPGSATETVVRLTRERAFGPVGGRETAAVILSTDPGGSGTFRDLAAVVRGPEGWVCVDTLSLGDRVRVHDIVIEDGAIVVDMTTHGPGDTMPSPSYRTSQSFVLEEDRLVRSPKEKPLMTSQATVGPVWKWVKTLYNNDTKAEPSDPALYTLQFREDGTAAIRADCNRAGGTYKISESHLTIEVTHTTRAACPPGSLESQYLKDLNVSVVHFIRDETLYIDLKYDTGTMQFTR
jgi:heat shock protein HslJ